MATVASCEAASRTVRELQRRDEKPTVRGVRAAIRDGSTTITQSWILTPGLS